MPRVSGDIRIRPLGPADRLRYLDFLAGLDPADLYLRTLGSAARPDAARVDALLGADGRRRIALAAVDAGRADAIVGVIRAAVAESGDTAEFALIVRSACKRRGLGERLLKSLLDELRALGVRRVSGETFASNQPLLGLARRLGFGIEPGDDGATRRVARMLEVTA